MTLQHRRHAFTLVELVMVIVIIGLLAAVVTPQFSSMKTEAQNAAEQGAVSAIRSGINLANMTRLAQGLDGYPSTLDSAANGVASATNVLFTQVIKDGVSDPNWQKTGNRRYRFNPTQRVYTYNQNAGTFTSNSP